MDVEECCNAEKLGLENRVTVGNQLKMEQNVKNIILLQIKQNETAKNPNDMFFNTRNC